MKRVAAALAISLAACSGGGGSSAPAVVPTAAPIASAGPGNALATLKIVIPPPPAHPSKRHPAFVASSTAGLLAQVYAHSDAAHAHLLDQLAVDISSGSTACGGTTGARTCSVQAPAPPGHDDIVITTYDQPPVGGSFTGANQLGAALVSGQTIAQGTANAISFVIGGIVKSIGLTIAPTVIHGTMPSTFNIAVTAFDADNNVIVTDGFVDALGNPVTIGLTEAPNPSLFTFTTSSLSAPSTTPILVTYSGTATSSFSGTITASAGSATGTATFKLNGPQVIEYSSGATTGPYGIALGADGRVWFGDNYVNQIGAMTTSGVVTNYSAGLSSNAQPYGVAPGADGRIWFAENGTGKFGAITTTGTITEYPVSAAGDAEQITEGPDSRIWCAEINSDNLCAVTTTGTVSTYPVTPAGANPNFVTNGPDGNVWATVGDGLNSYIIAMNTSGTEVHQYLVPGSGAFLFGITSGPDGRLWFCDSGNNYIWAVTTTGTFTHYSIPTGSVEPWSITAGPDGNLWFTEMSGPNVGRITTAGVVTEYPMPSGAGANPYYITVGADANLWFAEGTASNIGTMQW